VYVIEESEQYEEEPSEHAEIKLRITEVPADPAPTERAEVNFQLADSGGSIHVPERFTGQLIDGCIVIGCAVSTGLTTKWVLETAMDSMQGWMVLTVVTAQVAGIAVLAWRAMRRQRQA
jgi:hypothetical protein